MTPWYIVEVETGAKNLQIDSANVLLKEDAAGGGKALTLFGDVFHSFRALLARVVGSLVRKAKEERNPCSTQHYV